MTDVDKLRNLAKSVTVEERPDLLRACPSTAPRCVQTGEGARRAPAYAEVHA